MLYDKANMVEEHTATSRLHEAELQIIMAGNTKRGSITVPLTSCLTGLESAV